MDHFTRTVIYAAAAAWPFFGGGILAIIFEHWDRGMSWLSVLGALGLVVTSLALLVVTVVKNLRCRELVEASTKLRGLVEPGEQMIAMLLSDNIRAYAVIRAMIGAKPRGAVFVEKIDER